MVKKIIAIYGNGGSYKTTFALALARYIVGADPKADVVVVGADSTKPIIPLVAPQDKRFKGSIGNVLSAVSFEEDDLHKNLLMVDNRIGVLGYNIRENANTYPIVSNDRIEDMYTLLRYNANYTIVDCTSDIIHDKLTSQAIIKADHTIELLTCDINGVIFNGSQEAVLQSEQYRYRSFLRLLSLDNRFRQDEAAVKAAIGAISGTIPYSTNVAEAYNQAALLHDGVSDRVYKRLLQSVYELSLIHI